MYIHCIDISLTFPFALLWPFTIHCAFTRLADCTRQENKKERKSSLPGLGSAHPQCHYVLVRIIKYYQTLRSVRWLDSSMISAPRCTDLTE